jgi:hypothetical protein
LANGWTRLPLTINVVSVFIVAPLVVLLARWYGAVGAASVCVIFNAGYLVSSVTVMHRRLLPTEKWRWCVEDVGRPLLVAVVVSAAGRLLIRSDWPQAVLMASLAVVSVATLLATALAAKRLDVFARGKFLVGEWRLRAIARK